MRRDTRVEVLLSLGSNIEPARNLRRAVARLTDFVEVVALSSVWESDPVDAPGTPRFLNAGALARTELAPLELKRDVLRAIERELGRERVEGFKAAPRTIDLDLVAYGEQTIDDREQGVALPSQELVSEPYVALPLAEIAADWRDPRSGRTLGEIARALPKPAGMRVIEGFDWRRGESGELA